MQPADSAIRDAKEGVRFGHLRLNRGDTAGHTY